MKDFLYNDVLVENMYMKETIFVQNFYDKHIFIRTSCIYKSKNSKIKIHKLKIILYITCKNSLQWKEQAKIYVIKMHVILENLIKYLISILLKICQYFEQIKLFSCIHVYEKYFSTKAT